jgi:hypothetical protein
MQIRQYYVVAQKVPRIRCCHLEELLLWMKKCTLSSFVSLWMWLERNALKNGYLSVRFPFTTTLQHTDWFWSRISYQRTTWQHWSIPHTLLDCLHLIFICSLDWNQHRRDSTFTMLLRSLRMRRGSWKGFHKTVSRNVSNTFIFGGRNVYLYKGTIWKEIQIKLLYCSALIRNKVIPGTFWIYHVFHGHGNVFVQAHILLREDKIFIFSSFTHCRTFIRNT